MNESVDTQQAPGLRRVASALGVLVIACLLTLLAAIGYLDHYQKLDREHVAHSRAVGALAPAVGQHAGAAARGDADAFDRLDAAQQAVTTELERLADGLAADTLPLAAPVLVPALTALQQLESAAEALRVQADAVAAHRQGLAELQAAAARFNAGAPQMDRQVQQLAERLIATDAERSQLYLSAELFLTIERLSRHLGELLHGADAAAAAHELQARSEQLERALAALDQGREGVPGARLTDARARATLGAAQEQAAALRGELTRIVALAPRLAALREAGDATALAAAQLVTVSEGMTVQLQALSERRPVPDWLPLALGAAAIALLLLRALLARAIAAAELRAQQAAQAQVKRQARDNRLAMLALREQLQPLKTGDLTVQAVASVPLAADVADTVNQAVAALCKLMAAIDEQAEQLAAAAEQTQDTALQLTDASDDQAHQITLAAAAVDPLAEGIAQLAASASAAAELAGQSVASVAAGSATQARSGEGLARLQEQLERNAARVQQLGEGSARIASDIALIRDIAEQTGILALNASIQAAMAGDSGRGFGAVADQVQQLAERAGATGKQIEATIRQLQQDAGEAAGEMQHIGAEASSGIELTQQVAALLGELGEAAQGLTGMADDIFTAANEQSGALAELADSMQIIQEVTSQTTAGSNETAIAIANLTELAAALRRSLASLKLPG